MLGVATLLLGNGLIGTLLGLRAGIEAFPTAAIGIIMSAYYLGYIVGSRVAAQRTQFCNSPQMKAPEAYIHFTPGPITDDDEVTVPSTAEFLRNYMAEFHTFIGRVLSVLRAMGEFGG
jgi:chromate reductase